MSATAVFLHLFTPATATHWGELQLFLNTKIIFMTAVCLCLFTPATAAHWGELQLFNLKIVYAAAICCNFQLSCA